MFTEPIEIHQTVVHIIKNNFIKVQDKDRSYELVRRYM